MAVTVEGVFRLQEEDVLNHMYGNRRARKICPWRLRLRSITADIHRKKSH